MQALIIGLIGNPNSGKTTLFNRLTGLNQRIGNWAGVTLERQEGRFCTQRYRATLVDLPGTYSLTVPSEQAAIDERIACQYVGSGEAQLFINVVDAANLARNLYLTAQLLEMGIPCIIALNRLDSAQRQSIAIDIACLSTHLAVPVIPLVSTQGKGFEQLRMAIDSHSLGATVVRIPYPAVVETQIARIVQQLPSQPPSQLQPRWLALQLLEGDVMACAHYPMVAATVGEARHSVQQTSGEDVALLTADARYRYITTVYQAISQHRPPKSTMTKKLDRIVLSRWLGVPIFLLLIYLIFFIAINLGGALQPLFDQGSHLLFIQGTQWLGNEVGLPHGLTLLLARGIGGGINTLMPLVPQIGLMFLLVTLLEDSGYMARAAFVMDRLMQSLGLPGKAFVPLIVGFGCNVPAVMGARTLDSERERLLTVMMTPFMACSARLAIFGVFSATFFGRQGALPMFSLYLTGLVVAVLTGLLLKKTLMRGEALPFVMELPLYHRPHLGTLSAQVWQRLKGFVLRAGKVIILVNLLIGGLNSFSITGKAVDNNLQASALATVGRGLTPLLAPIGVVEENWPATVGLITGAIAKEVVLGTLNTLYLAEQTPPEPIDREDFNLLQGLEAAWQQTWQGLRETFDLEGLAHPVKASGSGMSSAAMGVMAKKFHTPAAAYSYLIFVLLYIPCASTVGAIGRESGRFWMWFSVLWGLDIAYSLAALTYQCATFSQHPLQSTFTIAIVVSINLLLFSLLRHLARTTACRTI